ncbi:MAG: transcriptional repressor [Propionibacteriaceae bacterium]|jgi:Fur family ferric uptake transcriptional regulator|nr:transcriptional repressor [Propionibacteriaceae bacterium]
MTNTDNIATDQSSRNTRQRAQVWDAIRACTGFVTAQQLHQQLADRGTQLGLSTVYRNLSALATTGDVDAVRNTSGEMTYRVCTPVHHHHLICRQCGRTVEIAAPSLERWASDVARKHGFSDIEHTLEVSGICPNCR